MKALYTFAIALAFLASGARADKAYTDIHGAGGNEVVPLVGCDANGVCLGPVSSANPLPVTLSGSGGGASGTPTQTGVSVTNASTTVLAAAIATTFIKLCVARSAANSVWVRWDGGTATQAAPSEEIPPGQCDWWIKSSGFLPTSQINAIASATVAVTLTYN